MRRLSDDRGAVLAFVALFFVGFLGLMAIAIDAGAWYQAQRNLQASADAAALAGAQDLPNTATALTRSTTYANANVTGSGSLTNTTTFPDTSTIDVQLSKPTPGFFARVLGITSVTVHGHARAQVGTPGSMKNLAAIVVNQNLACKTDEANCFGPAHTKDLDFDGTPGAGAGAGLVDLKGHNPSSTKCTANTNTGEMQDWIINGFAGFLPVNEWYASPPGIKNGVQTALNAVVNRLDPPLLFPVFDTGSGTACGGAGGFHIIGWSAFVITEVVHWNNGQGHLVRGYFVEYIAHDVDSVPGGGGGFGVKTITLTQ
jgi:hypothetical protein